MGNRWGVLLAALALAGCGGGIVPRARTAGSAPVRDERYREPSLPVRQPPPAIPISPQPSAPVPAGAASAVAAGVVRGPSLATLPLGEDGAGRALAAFRLSCPALRRRTDVSGLTRAGDWDAACDAAASVREGEARSFFLSWFDPVQVGDGRAYATGYYEPEIAASRERRPGYDVPIYARPRDLIDVDLGQFSTALKGKSIRGRVEGQALVPYYDRTAIEQGAIDAAAPVLAWGADPVEVFFLQVQGSGRLRLPDRSVMRIGYATQNGRDYTGIGALMRARGLLGGNQLSMQGIVAWLHAHPDQATAIMRENKSFVFFRPLSGPPEGALGVVVTGGVTVAADPRFVPLGAPLFLSLDRSDATGLWVAQDTGGAIKGPNRFDTFWGAGAEATAIAGGMAGRGVAVLLLPRGVLDRLGAGGADAGAAAQP
jgi:membrane-bound lytic murein transglycosylase A